LSCGRRWKAASNAKQQTKTLRLLTTSEYSLIAQQNLFTVTSVDAGNLRAGVSESADRSHAGLHSACTATWSAVTHLTEKEQSTSSPRRIGLRRLSNYYQRPSYSFHSSNVLPSVAIFLGPVLVHLVEKTLRPLTLKIVCRYLLDGDSSSRQTVSSPDFHQLFLLYSAPETPPSGSNDWSR